MLPVSSFLPSTDKLMACALLCSVLTITDFRARRDWKQSLDIIPLCGLFINCSTDGNFGVAMYYIAHPGVASLPFISTSMVKQMLALCCAGDLGSSVPCPLVLCRCCQHV